MLMAQNIGEEDTMEDIVQSILAKSIGNQDSCRNTNGHDVHVENKPMFVAVCFKEPSRVEINQHINVCNKLFEFHLHVSVKKDGNLETHFKFSINIFFCINMNLPERSKLIEKYKVLYHSCFTVN